jgi:hypothetical protein
VASSASSRCSISTVDEAERFCDALENFNASLKVASHSSTSSSTHLHLKDSSLDWPWAPDYELLLRTPRKKNWESSSRKENLDSSRGSSRTSTRASSRASSRTSRSQKKKVSGNDKPRPLGPPVQEEVDLSSRTRRVLQEVQGIEGNVPGKSSFEDEDQKKQRGKVRLKDWCIEKGLQCFNHGHKHKHKHHTHAPSEDQKEFNGPRRNSSKDPPPRAHNRDYGQSQDAVRMWKSCQPKQPHKGDLEVLPSQPAPRQLYLD